MSKGGRYLKKPTRKASSGKKSKKLLLIVLLSLLALIIVGIIAGVLYWHSLLDMMGDAKATETMPTISQEEINAMLNVTEATEADETVPTESTSPEDTWPVVVSNENITNFMLVGQNYREGEAHKLSDTMILCSINRETKTLTMMSIFRDLYVDFPPYKSLGWGRNRINVCYNLGCLETGTPEGGMEMLAQAVEFNFGIPIDHSIEIDFEAFEEIIDTLGGVEIELNEDEANYLTKESRNGSVYVAGENLLDGQNALNYARMRHSNAGDSDIKRTARQRALISQILEECRNMGLMDLHKMATAVLPLITTDMSNSEITNYVWEFLPMLKDLKIVSMTLPVDNQTLPGSYGPKIVQIYDNEASVIVCDVALNRKYVTETLGLVETEE